MEKKAQTSQTIVIQVIGIGCCNGCRRKVKKALLKLPGVESVDIDAENKLVHVKSKVDPLLLVKTIEKKGKKAEILPHLNEDSDNQSNSETYSNECKNDTMNSQHNKVSKNKCGCQNGKNGSKKEDRSHHQEEYDAPPEVDETICRDPFCNIHKGGGIHGPSNGANLLWNHPNYGRGYFQRNSHYSQWHREVPPRHQMPGLPYYGIHPGKFMPVFPNFHNENARGCTMM